MNLSPIIEHFSNYTPLDDLEIIELKSKIREKKVKRRHFILQEGDVCKHVSFVVNGCFKMYKVDNKGSEHNLQFSIENGWIADLGSFYTNQPSELYIEALEPSTILQITHDDMIYLYTNYPKFDKIFRVLIENAFIKIQKRVLQNISSTAEERYLDFLKNYPNLFNRISNVQIASYIGVTPEFLSKIRKNITTK